MVVMVMEVMVVMVVMVVMMVMVATARKKGFAAQHAAPDSPPPHGMGPKRSVTWYHLDKQKQPRNYKAAGIGDDQMEAHVVSHAENTRYYVS